MKKLWDSLSNSQRISIIAVAVLTVVGLYAFSHWRYESDFRPLYTGMAPEDAAAVTQKLRESGVDYRLADNGATVLVPSAKQAESRLTLAAAGLPKTGRIGFELFDKNNFGATEFVEHINYQRALEGELERSVMSLAEVEQARVHITMAKDSVFLEQQQPAKASVMVKLRPHMQMSPQNVVAITNLVASAVEGLVPEAVSVVDMNGNLLSRPRRLGAADGAETTSETLELRQQFEKDLINKIRATLEPILGPDRFRAGASVDIDLTSGDQQDETFDPAKTVMVSSQKTEDVVDRASTAGVPGTASNLPRGNASPSSAAGVGSARRSESVTYQSSRTVRHTRIPQGMIKRMSLAVLLDQTAHWEGQGANRHRVFDPPKPETIQSIKGLITAATGLDANRGDQLIVESLPFETTVNPPTVPGELTKTNPAPTGPKWLQFLRQYRDLLVPALIAIGVLAIVIFVIFRIMAPQPPPVPETTPELEAGRTPAELEANASGSEARQVSASTLARQEDSDIAERVRQMAKRDSGAAANVVRMWLQEGKT